MEIVGGAMSGYCSIGSDINPIIPKRTKKIDITVDNTGRLMKFVNVITSTVWILRTHLDNCDLIYIQMSSTILSIKFQAHNLLTVTFHCLQEA